MNNKLLYSKLADLCFGSMDYMAYKFLCQYEFAGTSLKLCVLKS